MNLTESDIQRFWGKVAIKEPKACWEWQGCKDSTGYGFFKSKRSLRAHRVAYFLSVENLDTEKEILHLCNNKACCNPMHLVQDTRSANVRQAWADGLMDKAKGGVNSREHLNQAALIDILTSSDSTRAAGQKYGVSHTLIRRIRKDFICQIPSQSQE